ncbi:hypothetical protein Efla_001792 [Eimeria flavescens]
MLYTLTQFLLILRKGRQQLWDYAAGAAAAPSPQASSSSSSSICMQQGAARSQGSRGPLFASPQSVQSSSFRCLYTLAGSAGDAAAATAKAAAAAAEKQQAAVWEERHQEWRPWRTSSPPRDSLSSTGSSSSSNCSNSNCSNSCCSSSSSSN